MLDPKKGKTLWEMLMDRLHGSNGSGVAFYNPLGLTINASTTIAYANGPELADYDFTVKEIREYSRHIGEQVFQFTDYRLEGLNKKTFAAESALPICLRAVPNQAGAHDTLLLRLYDEFAFAEDFLSVVKDTTGIFEIEDEEDSGAKATFYRINAVRSSFEAAVLSISDTNLEGKASSKDTKAKKVEYWDYWRDEQKPTGKSSKEFVFVEMDEDTGWFQIWRGREFFS
jgi:hypothetical protein